ncbi:MAG: hypothetical protein LUD74_00775 [Tannerellaceae bacterium]|nr:hypothetical protein [Tannerellaceae bacterium]
MHAVKENEEFEYWIVPEEKLETKILTDQIQSITHNDTTGVTPYLINLNFLDDKKSYLIQIAYISLINSQPVLKAIFEFVAYEKEDSYLFASPLLRNTQEWKTKTAGYLIFHYPNEMAERVIDQYISLVTVYDKKLGISKTTEYYLCDDCQDMESFLRLCGILYQRAYNGNSWPMADFHFEEKIIALYSRGMLRKEYVDPHDVFHGRANIVSPADVRNYYMICGYAYVCGGTWSGTWRVNWKEIKQRFKETLWNDKNVDWLNLYFDQYNFGESKERPIILTQFINALILETVEKEKGFADVMLLFKSGNMYQGRKQFFSVLEEITGINEVNFNDKVEEIIKNLSGL